jgi:hypothetical protein
MRYTVKREHPDSDFIWALEMMMDGVMVRRRTWGRELSVTMVPRTTENTLPTFVWTRNGDAFDTGNRFVDSEILATDLELY